MPSAAATLLDPSLSLLTSLSLGSGCSDVRTIGPAPQVPRDCAQSAYHMYIGFPWLPCPSYSAIRAKVPSSRHAQKHSESGIIPQVGISAFGVVACRVNLIVPFGRLQGAYSTCPPVGSKETLVQQYRRCHIDVVRFGLFEPSAFDSRATISCCRER